MRTASVDWDTNMSEESALLVCGWQLVSVLHSTEGHSATVRSLLLWQLF